MPFCLTHAAFITSHWGKNRVTLQFLHAFRVRVCPAVSLASSHQLVKKEENVYPKNMASYYDEHNCPELAAGEEPDHWLHLARLLLDSGLAVDLEMEFSRIFGDDEMPGAGKSFIDSLPEAADLKDDQCAICLSNMIVGKDSSGEKKGSIKQLPCSHTFHKDCIIPWITRVASCPLCKYELPTDDDRFEEYKKQKKRAKERDAMLEELHGSMFG